MNLEKLVLPLESNHKAFNAGIAAAAAGVTALIGAMTLAVKSTFTWANELDQLQDVMGVTNKKAAALNFVLRKSGVATETLAKGVVILEKGLVKADGTLDTVGKSLKDFGINIFDANGGMKEQDVLLDDIATKYDSFATQQEKVNFLTETFGRSGAELIDFFDTLAADGGIDAVAEKVERLGLAIDPNRYEQFNRSIEELKLIGLGLAVSFTEEVMPVLEQFLGIITDPNMTFADKVMAIGEGVGEFVSTWYNELKTKMAAINWEQVSQDIANFINNIDWAKAGFNFAKFWEDVSGGMIKFGKEFDWLSVGNALGSAFNNFWAGMFGMTEAEVQYKLKSTLNSLSDAIESWLNNIRAYLAGFGLDVGMWKNNFNLPTFDMSGYGSNPTFRNPGAGSGGGVTAGNYTYQNGVYTLNRASGGPVIAGQSYNVAEFFRPEVFTPATNGRIDSAGSGPVVVNFDEERLARVMTSVLQPLLT